MKTAFIAIQLRTEKYISDIKIYEVCPEGIRPAFISSRQPIEQPLRDMSVNSNPSQTPGITELLTGCSGSGTAYIYLRSIFSTCRFFFIFKNDEKVKSMNLH